MIDGGHSVLDRGGFGGPWYFIQAYFHFIPSQRSSLELGGCLFLIRLSALWLRSGNRGLVILLGVWLSPFMLVKTSLGWNLKPCLDLNTSDGKTYLRRSTRCTPTTGSVGSIPKRSLWESVRHRSLARRVGLTGLSLSLWMAVRFMCAAIHRPIDSHHQPFFTDLLHTNPPLCVMLLLCCCCG